MRKLSQINNARPGRVVERGGRGFATATAAASMAIVKIAERSLVLIRLHTFHKGCAVMC